MSTISSQEIISIIKGEIEDYDAHAGQINETEAYRPEGLFKDAVKGLDTYGAKVVRPKELYVVKAHNS